MIVLLTGLPGVGKGTQADLIVQKYKIGHLSTGNVFRELMQTESPLSTELKTYINAGNLVPDELTIKVLQEEIKKDKYQNGFLLDGFPRTVKQAEFLDQMLKEENLKLDYVINLYLEDQVIKERLVNRLFCPNCQSTFHKLYLPPKVEGTCDKCGSNLIQREDDKIDKIEQRLKVAKEQTIPVLEYYKEEVKTIDSDNKDTQTIFKEIEGIINDHN